MVENRTPQKDEAYIDVIRRRREQLGWTQFKLASESKFNLNGISSIENGRNDPRLSSLRKICDALGLVIKIELAEEAVV